MKLKNSYEQLLLNQLLCFYIIIFTFWFVAFFARCLVLIVFPRLTKEFKKRSVDLFHLLILPVYWLLHYLFLIFI